MITPPLPTFDELLRRVEYLIMDIDRLNRKVDILERKEARKTPTPEHLPYSTPPISPRRGKECPSHGQESQSHPSSDDIMDTGHVIDLTF